MDTTVDHFTPLALRVRGNKILTDKNEVNVSLKAELLVHVYMFELGKIFVPG